MCNEEKKGTSVFISADILDALDKRRQQLEEAGKNAGLDPLCLHRPTVGWQVRSYLRSYLGLPVTHGGE